MLIYEKKVLSDHLDQTSEKVRRLFGTAGSIPSNSDQPLIYKDADGDEISSEVVSNYKYVYNYNGGLKASTFTSCIPSSSDTVLNVFLNDGTPVINSTLMPIKSAIALRVYKD